MFNFIVTFSAKCIRGPSMDVERRPRTVLPASLQLRATWSQLQEPGCGQGDEGKHTRFGRIF